MLICYTGATLLWAIVINFSCLLYMPQTATHLCCLHILLYTCNTLETAYRKLCDMHVWLYSVLTMNVSFIMNCTAWRNCVILHAILLAQKFEHMHIPFEEILHDTAGSSVHVEEVKQEVRIWIADGILFLIRIGLYLYYNVLIANSF